MSTHFYLTTTLPYVNAPPHVGFALEIIEADVIARFHQSLGEEVFFNTGTDEHGQKIYQNALTANQDPQAYCDQMAAKFRELKTLLNLSPKLKFIRTTDQNHLHAAQEFWRRVKKNGYIYQKTYQAKYCVGCEMEKTDSELVDGFCPLHPNKPLELREEENYFFAFSKFEQPLLDFYQKHPDFVKPVGKYKEIVSFVQNGLQDFSISRLKDKMPWGIIVPDDPTQVMYVWFDALVNYISTLGWPDDQTNFEKFWPGIQLCGKDNLRQQAAMWQAMLMAADLPNSKQILINGFISVNGQKMSKSLGNVISPTEMVERYGVDAARYLLISLGTFGEDMDISWEKLDEKYTADLANGLGNLCSRVAKMCEKAHLGGISPANKYDQNYLDYFAQYNLTEIIKWLIAEARAIDNYLSEQKPWELSGAQQTTVLIAAVTRIQNLCFHFLPFMPEVADLIIKHFSQDRIVALKPLFPRLK